MDYQQKITEIALKIREIRQLGKMTIQELAYRCEMERSNMCRIETGKTNLTIKTLCKICTALDIELNALVSDKK